MYREAGVKSSTIFGRGADYNPMIDGWRPAARWDRPYRAGRSPRPWRDCVRWPSGFRVDREGGLPAEAGRLWLSRLQAGTRPCFLPGGSLAEWKADVLKKLGPGRIGEHPAPTVSPGATKGAESAHAASDVRAW